MPQTLILQVKSNAFRILKRLGTELLMECCFPHRRYLVQDNDSQYTYFCRPSMYFIYEHSFANRDAKIHGRNNIRLERATLEIAIEIFFLAYYSRLIASPGMTD